MKENNGGEDALPQPPDQLFERLAQLKGYTWDQSTEPFHSSYDNWHVFGLRHHNYEASGSSPTHGGASVSSRNSPKVGTRPSLKHFDTSSAATDDLSSAKVEEERTYTPVIARISTHSLRLEREFHLCRLFMQTTDPDCQHTVRPIDLLRLPSYQGKGEPFIVSIFESPGRNYLIDLVDFGQAWLHASGSIPRTLQKRPGTAGPGPRGQVSLLTFLDFAIGATSCLELLHHGLRVVHGELRADAFHFNQQTRAVRLVNFGTGRRSFENGFTSAGWSKLSKELGVKTKLQFIAPEQTGRLSGSPDSRSDIYSLGVLLWTMLTGQPAFDGNAPIDVIQAVLNRRIPSISSIRMDVPDIISSILQKMTQKQSDDRYHSTSGVKHDFVEVQRILAEGDGEALLKFEIGSKDVSSLFLLPNDMFGRVEEHQKITTVVDKLVKSHPTALDRNGSSALYSVNSASASTISDHLDNGDDAIRSSSVSSQDRASSSNLASSSGMLTNGFKRHSQADSSGRKDSLRFVEKPPLETGDSKDSVETAISMDSVTSSTGFTTTQWNGHGQMSIASRAARQRASQKYKARHSCEVIVISGSAGVGKSCLIQSVQEYVRQKAGYSSTAKFERTRTNPFEPVFRSISSLFRQVFSESNINGEYHNVIRRQLKSFWPSLCGMLDLPEDLLASDTLKVEVLKPNINSRQSQMSSDSVHSGVGGSLLSGPSETLRTNTTSKSLKIINMIAEVLRVLSTNRLLCLCLEDLQYADGESLELLSSIIARKLGLALIISCRDEMSLPYNVRIAINSGSAKITRVEMAPLKESDVLDFVAATLHREKEYVTPLAMVCLERTNGNPFYLRQMLEVCHQKGCIWYTWKESAWEFDLDRVFAEFETESHGQRLDSNFVTKRLRDLPPAARSILAWASLLGSTFSFSFVQRLLLGEFNDTARDCDMYGKDGAATFDANPVDGVVEGLNACLQALVLVPDSDDDRFSFSHDRYIQASASLRECHNVEKMHFTIARTMMKYPEGDDSFYSRARHIWHSANLIRGRVPLRYEYRQILLQAARKAIESGSRPTAREYLEGCVKLLQPAPWTEGVDANYAETLEIHTKVSDIYWHQEQFDEAQNMLIPIFNGARSATDKAAAWIIQSRIFSRQADLGGAFEALKTSLVELGLVFRPPTAEACDQTFLALRQRLDRENEINILQKPVNRDPKISAMGLVLFEAISAAFWNDSLFFQMATMMMVQQNLECTGCMDQIGASFAYFAMITTHRFPGDLTFTMKTYGIGLQLLRKCSDPSSVGRGLAVATIFVAHLFSPLADHFAVLEEASDLGLVSGDKHLYLFTVSAIALNRLFIGGDMSELEMYCNIAPEDFGNWERDLRGGVSLVACRQLSRSMQGKTDTSSPSTVMSDDQHDTTEYLDFISSNMSNPSRSLYLYKSLLIVALYSFGHYKQAIMVGDELLSSMDYLFSFRNNRLTLFYLSVSLLADARESIPKGDLNPVLDRVLNYKERILQWQIQCDVNYRMWSLLIEAEICEITGRYHDAIQAYEAAIDHTQLHDFVFEQALTFEMQGEFYIRRGAKRAAASTILEACATYSRISASGKVAYLTTKHEWVLKSAKTARCADAGVQTIDSLVSFETTRFHMEEHDRQQDTGIFRQSSKDRTDAWISPSPAQEPKRLSPTTRPDVTDLGLDILDLQSLLDVNQAISSELQLDRLLVKMTQISLEFTGAQADFAGIVIEDEAGWNLAASGTPDDINDQNISLLELQDETRRQAMTYAIRFKEVLMIENTRHDDRFSNTPGVRAIMCLPIIRGKDMLGVLYLEGQPNSFTDRNLGVLQLFIAQVGISIANALLFRKVEKVSAWNRSMIEEQKRAVAAAREGERRAMKAEAEAMESVRLKEEAAKAKSMFLANVSHELRTPLNGVIGMSELLKGSPLNQEQEGYADSIRVCADTLLTVINDILDFSKLEAGKMQLFSVPLNLKDKISEVVRALSYVSFEKDLKTVEDLDLDSKLLVIGDPVRLHQIFMNLLSNAYKFTAQGSVTIRSRCECEDKRSIRVTFSVADTGIGITQEQVSRLFKPFSQADSSTQRSYGGSGLGLSICKALIDVLKGRIWLESQMGKGTTVFFTLTFPKAPKTVTAANASTKTSEPDPMAKWSSDVDGVVGRLSKPATIDLSNVPRDQLRICIAEDNPINQKIAISFVTKLGFKSEAYSDGQQAVEALRRTSAEGQPFHLVLMDVQMPVLDGYDATKVIRQDKDPAVRDVLVIAMTASAIRGDREKCLEAGMNNYLAKPVRAAVLKTMLEEYLSQASKPVGDLKSVAEEMAEKAIQEVNVKGRPRLEKKMTSRFHGESEMPLRTRETKDVGVQTPTREMENPMEAAGLRVVEENVDTGKELEKNIDDTTLAPGAAMNGKTA